MMIRIAAALAFTLATTLAHARGGDLDTTLGNDGFAPVLQTTNDLNLVIGRAPDGGYIVVRNRADGVAVMRRNADGTADTTFGTAGEVLHPRAVPTGSMLPIVPLAVKRLTFQGAKILLAGESTSGCGTPGLARLNADGSVDTTFGDRGWSAPLPGTRGVASCRFGSGFAIPELRILADGRIALVSQAFSTDGSLAVEGDTIAGRWSANGTPDASFGAGGFVSSVFAWRHEGGGARVMDDGAVVMVHSVFEAPGRFRVVVTRLAADGRRLVETPLAATAEFTGAAVAGVVQDDASVLVFRREAPGGVLSIARFSTEGSPPYEAAGIFRVDLGHPTYVRAALPAPDGGTLFVVDSQDAQVDGRNDTIVLLKLDATMAREPSFGVAGRADLSSGSLSEYPHQATLDRDGYLALVGYTTFRSGGDARYSFYFSRVQAVPDIVEFENAALRHFFITYDNAEARGIDAGAAGPGWVRSGLSFRPGGSAAVCRFYGTPGLGPNSHFYTADPEECERVKGDRGWTYEGIAFHVTTPTDGRCIPSTQRPIIRFYNNRAAQNDSNHRYLANEALAASMVAQGWILEGLVFCPPR